jgi:hypothetical protein
LTGRGFFCASISENGYFRRQRNPAFGFSSLPRREAPQIYLSSVFSNLCPLNPITDNGGITKTGAGTLILTDTGALTESDVIVNNSGTFELHGKAGKNVSLTPSAATLNAYPGGRIGGSLTAMGATLNFYLSENVAAGNTLLIVGGEARIGGRTVNVGIQASRDPKGRLFTLARPGNANTTANSGPPVTAFIVSTCPTCEGTPASWKPVSASLPARRSP